MPPTVDPADQARRRQVYTALFFLGAFMLAAAVLLTFPTLQFAFEEGATGTDSGERVLEYEHLTDEEQRVVDGALDGRTYRLESTQPLPGTPGYTLEPEQLRVAKNGTTHAFTYWMVFPATERMGMAVIALAVGGLLAIAESVRQRHFSS